MQSTAPTTWEASNQIGQTLGHVILAQVVESGADIDISGLEFDFVRSIRVWDVRHYSHRERGRDDDCSESYNMRLGTYGTQGEFGWQRTTRGPNSDRTPANQTRFMAVDNSDAAHEWPPGRVTTHLFIASRQPEADIVRRHKERQEDDEGFKISVLS